MCIRCYTLNVMVTLADKPHIPSDEEVQATRKSVAKAMVKTILWAELNTGMYVRPHDQEMISFLMDIIYKK